MMYTLEIYKKDGRCKDGEKLIEKNDKEFDTLAEAEKFATFSDAKIRVEIHETYVEKRNIMNGKTYTERYDTPRCCSPSTELYWSM